jgi:hypothetical protein
VPKAASTSWIFFHIYSLCSGAKGCQHFLAVCLPADGRGTRTRDTRCKIRYLTVLLSLFLHIILILHTVKLLFCSESIGYLKRNLELFEKRSHAILMGSCVIFKWYYENIETGILSHLIVDIQGADDKLGQTLWKHSNH